MDDTYKRTCFVDLDGVLANFDRGFYEITGKDSENVQDQELWAAIDAYGKARFFGELPWMPDGKELWNFVSSNFLKVKILSALGKTDNDLTAKGKLQWLRHNIPTLQLDDIILVKNKYKKKHYCKRGDIMIDDAPIVIDEWSKKGGIGILHKTTQDTINILKKYV